MTLATEMPTVFYSWESDLPESMNRAFIQQALEDAVRSIRVDPAITVEPVVERDTVGVPGSPNIAQTILSKIDRASVFVSDVSIINSGEGNRPTPNPNVLFELGWAMKSLGDQRIIMVQNTEYGGPAKLPFDLKFNRIEPYSLAPGDVNPEATRIALAKKLEDAIRSILQHAKAVINESEAARRREVLKKLRAQYILTRDDISSAMMSGLAPIPKEWVENHLRSMGEDWRQESYY